MASLTMANTRAENNRFLFLLPHERSHGIMRILENARMLPKALKMRAIKDTMALGADSTAKLMAQNVHLRKCRGTLGIPILPCSISKEGGCSFPPCPTPIRKMATYPEAETFFSLLLCLKIPPAWPWSLQLGAFGDRVVEHESRKNFKVIRQTGLDSCVRMKPLSERN